MYKTAESSSIANTVIGYTVASKKSGEQKGDGMNACFKEKILVEDQAKMLSMISFLWCHHQISCDCSFS